jgi:hypothetical protein
VVVSSPSGKDTLTSSHVRPNMAWMRAMRSRIARGFVFGFSAAVGAWLAFAALSLILVLILRPWG